MSSRRIAFYLDSLLLVVFLTLMAPRLTGLSVHEWLGMGLGLPLLVHLLLGWSWLATAARRAIRPRRRRETVNLILNASLFVTTTVVVVSGLVVSQVSVPSLGVQTIADRVWLKTHTTCTTLMLWILGAHLAMNWQWIATTGRSVFRRASGN